VSRPRSAVTLAAIAGSRHDVPDNVPESRSGWSTSRARV
jgi:hypothetical protein